MIYDFKQNSKSSHRMTSEKVEKIIDDLKAGQSIRQIAKNNNCDRATIYYYQKKFVIKKIPIEKKSYQEIFEEEEKKRLERQVNCSHLKWIKRCSVCNAILESEKQVNTHVHAKGGV